MADYFPLLARALDTMSDRGPDMRRQVYERARSALLTQLRTLDPPLGEAEIERERLALEDAVTRAEAVYGGDAPPPATVPPEPEPAVVAEEPAPEPAERPRVEPRPAIRRGRSKNRSLTLAVGLVVIMIPVAIVGWLWRDRPAPQPQTTPQVARTAPAAPEPSNDSKFADRIGGPAPTQPAPAQPAPSVPTPQPQTSQPAQTAPAQLSTPTAPSAAPSAPVPSPVAQAPATPAPAPQSPATSTPAAPAAPAVPAAPVQPELAVAQRAVLIQENTADPQNPKVTAGRTLWRLDALNSGQGQPLETVVRANVDLPEAGLSLSMVIRRNSDATFPASHTIELTFTPADPTNQDRIARDVGLPQLKPDDTQRGTPLAGLSVPVKENIFLIGLSDLKGDIERNTDLLLHRNLIDLPVRFASGQRAVISFEKGVSGDRVVTEAFRQWAATP